MAAIIDMNWCESNRTIMAPTAAVITSRGGLPPLTGVSHTNHGQLQTQMMFWSPLLMSLAMTDWSVHRGYGQQWLSHQWDWPPEGEGLLLQQ